MRAEPGWYPDPQNPGYLRWWDGAVWSDQVRPAAPPAMPPPLRTASTDEQALAQKVAAMRAEYEMLRKQIVETSDAMILQEVGIYQYAHPLDSSAAYKDALAQLNEAIKACVKRGGAVTSTKKWVINGSEKEGAKMVSDFSKLILRAFNNEADNVLRTLKPYTLDAAVERLEKLRVTAARRTSEPATCTSSPTSGRSAKRS